MNICDIPIGSQIIIDGVGIYEIKNLYMKEYWIELEIISGPANWKVYWQPYIDWFTHNKNRWKPVASYTSKQWRYK